MVLVCFGFCSNVNRTFCAANSGHPDQMQHCVARLGLCGLPIASYKLIWDN